ncbi:midas domain-containing protein [Natronolimnohabitans innermongolicus]|uniref:Uncharacterized protein n=1 Tax=Natronolimnohabitans innermongolicus JCM 12255 TaxID=1227499 RepID=L9WV46_9EURY|nr:hypothetical protein [Natronolimnohabitans innermongolicus]ELY53297.1 hypothetical protein C493_14743 [Natronolimnohabitans innermongolicus JCM 12255]
MHRPFTDDDVGKPVRNAAGEDVGVVAAIEGNVAHVRPNADAIDSVTSSIGWEGVTDETRPLEADSVREVTADAVRLEGELPTEAEGASEAPEVTETSEPSKPSEAELTTRGDETADRQDRGLEADPTELVGGTDTPGTPSGISVDRTEDRSPTDATLESDEKRRQTDARVDPDADREPTDATVEPTDGPGRTDAAVDPEIDPDAISDPRPPDGGSTAERGETANRESERKNESDDADGDDGR